MIGGVVGYTYQAENLCPTCTLKTMRANGIKVQVGRPHEEAVAKAAEKLGIDYENEHSYDSGDFPKPVTTQMCETELTELPDGERGAISDEQCAGCGKWLILGEKSPTESKYAKYLREQYELPQKLARQVAGQLREWGLSHPEFIDGDNVKQAASMFPHDFRAVAFRGNPQQIVMFDTPEYDEDTCLDCEKPWEEHTFVCDVCKAEVPAVGRHRHSIQAKRQIKLK